MLCIRRSGCAVQPDTTSIFQYKPVFFLSFNAILCVGQVPLLPRVFTCGVEPDITSLFQYYPLVLSRLPPYVKFRSIPTRFHAGSTWHYKLYS